MVACVWGGRAPPHVAPTPGAQVAALPVVAGSRPRWADPNAHTPSANRPPRWWCRWPRSQWWRRPRWAAPPTSHTPLRHHHPHPMPPPLTAATLYLSIGAQVAAIPVVAGRKSRLESFAGANRTYTIEAMMGDRKALQVGGSGRWHGCCFKRGWSGAALAAAPRPSRPMGGGRKALQVGGQCISCVLSGFLSLPCPSGGDQPQPGRQLCSRLWHSVPGRGGGAALRPPEQLGGLHPHDRRDHHGPR